jgi:hypothetical protein
MFLPVRHTVGRRVCPVIWARISFLSFPIGGKDVAKRCVIRTNERTSGGAFRWGFLLLPRPVVRNHPLQLNPP